ncbi:MAG: alpha/beta fold hydrolase [Acidimicrobiales bacterium]
MRSVFQTRPVQRRSPSGLAVWEDGPAEAAVAVLVHGTMDRARSFAKTIRRLPHVRLVSYDRRGYGASLEVAPAGFDRQAADLLEVLDGRPGVLVGHSFGGALALAAAARAPGQVGAVAAFEAPRPIRPGQAAGAVPPPADDDPAAAAERFLRRLFGDRIWERLPAEVREERRREGAAMRADRAALSGVGAPGARYDDGALTMPVLAGRGSASEERLRRAADDLAAAAAKGELFVCEGAAHAAHLTHPDCYAAFVATALQRGGCG